MQIGIWIGMVVSLIVAFIIGNFYGQELNWYLFILMLVIGAFINIVILILKTKDENVWRFLLDYKEHNGQAHMCSLLIILLKILLIFRCLISYRLKIHRILRNELILHQSAFHIRFFWIVTCHQRIMLRPIRDRLNQQNP